MALHNEIEFEKEICDYLGSHGWIYEDCAATDYDRKLALYPPDLFAWLEQAQEDSGRTTSKRTVPRQNNLPQRLRDVLQQTGTLDLLRKGLEVAANAQAAEFKPASGSTRRSVIDMKQTG